MKKGERKAKAKAFVKAIKANRRDASRPASIIFTNIESEKKNVRVPDWLRYLFG